MTPVPTIITPKTSSPRPPLPLAHANPLIKSSLDRTKEPQVKYQVITREGQEIVVGRVKVQTPGGGHAFILRRFDTGAISLTTMFRAAFPTANEDAERTEAAWVKANFDAPATHGMPSAKLRLAGTWVAPDVAATIADGYALGNIVLQLANAVPDPLQEYRKSTKGQASQPTSPPAPPSPAASPIAASGKRRKDASPSPVPAPAPAKRRKEASPVPAASAPAALPPARRTSRTRSPAPITQTQGRPVPRATRASGRLGGAATRVHEPLTPAPSDQTIVDEDTEVADVPGPDMATDVAEQRALIAQLKSERAQKLAAPAVGLEAPADAIAEGSAPKRSLEETEEKLQFQFKEPEVGERTVVSNRRVGMQPQQKSAAWGVALFAFGFAAMATLPSYFF